MSAALKAAISDLLLNDAEFVADMQALGLQTSGAPAAPSMILKGYRPLKAIGQERYPCWVIESGDDESIEESIGSGFQRFETEILLTLIWHQEDPETSVDQRDGLLPALVRLFLRNPSPADCGIRVDARGNDRNVNHPTHMATFRLLAEVDISR